jgi:hypothetical protein
VALTRGLATLVLEVVGILGAVGVLAALTIGRRPTASELRFATVAAVGALTVALALGQLAAAGSTLDQARRGAVSAPDGIEHCFGEQRAQARLPFVRWLKMRLPKDAVYALDYTPAPDVLCVALVLLPALPAAPGQRAEWTIAFGAIPPAMQARINAHDPSVQVFAPGFGLERGSS